MIACRIGARSVVRAAGLLAGLFLVAIPVHAQTPAPPAPPRTAGAPLTSIYQADFLRDLPTSDNLFAVVDALQPSIIADRFPSGGLYPGQSARLGGFLSSWTQTRFSIDGVPFTDPTGNGAPLLFPELMPWSAMRVDTGGLGGRTNAPGLAIDLMSTRPADHWHALAEGAISHGFLNAVGANAEASPIARLESVDRVGVVASGPLVRDRVGATFAVSSTRGAQFERGDLSSVDASVQSVLSQFVFTPSAVNSIRVLGWLQRRDQPLSQRMILRQPQETLDSNGGHGQIVWEHGHDSRTPWSLSGSLTARTDTPDDTDAIDGFAERLIDGPLTQFASLAKTTVRAWSAGAHVEPRRVVGRALHQISAGIDAEGGQLTSSSFYDGTIGETVHGVPARVWQFTSPSETSRRHSLILGGYLGDRLSWGDRLTVDGSVRLESATGSAEHAVNGISWQSILPHAGIHLPLSHSGALAAFGSYGRTAYRLTLDDLAIGDPAAPTAAVYRWNTLAGYPLSLDARGALVARTGPGTGGVPAFAAIDPDLKRPTSDEFVVGIEAQPASGILLRLAGIARTERNLAGLINPGAPASTSYTSFTVQDPGGDVLNPADDQTLTVYNRIPASFGHDRYVLTTPGDSGSTFKGIELTMQFQTGRFTLTGGATAGIAETFAANAGYGPLENDQAVLGELLTNPNASTLAHGRPFTDRAYTGKFAMVYRLPSQIRLGLIARYQDGQAFSRVLVFPGLNQGADPVRAFSNGESRFMFVGTLDGHLQKGFTAGGQHVDLFVDAYNLLNMQNSVEEDIAAAPDVRVPTAIQPPRSVHVGLRFSF
jgi:hypothetical protein